MAIILEANYAKKIGLPGYSSHQYSVTVRTEVSSLEKIEEASGCLYERLQGVVDRDISKVGYLPGNDYSGSVVQFDPGVSENNRWRCTSRQQSFIEKLMNQKGIGFPAVNDLARERFRQGVKSLNKLQASQLIDEMFQAFGSKQMEKEVRQ